MLTLDQLEKIAHILAWTVREVESSLGGLNKGFMVPDVQDFQAGDWQDEDGEDCEAGIYSRLSAPGYLDCTDWSGPFETVEDAVADLLSTYAE